MPSAVTIASVLVLSMMMTAPAAAAERRVGALQRTIGNPAGLRLSGSVRVRTEFIDNQVRPGFNANEDLLSLRTNVLAESGDGPVRLVVELWDSRTWTIQPGSAAGTGEVNTLEPVQAHLSADLGALLGPGTSVGIKAGRMVLNLGSRRLIAADDYRNTTNGYTGVRVDLAGGDLWATLIYVLPQIRRPDDFESVRNNRPAIDHETFDLQLWGGVAGWHHALGPTSAELSIFGTQERDSPGRGSRDRRLRTIDLRLIREPRAGAFDHEIEAAWQWGQERATLSNVGPLRDVAAGFVHADAGYTFAGGWNPRLSAEFDFISGDRPGGRITRFDTLFGMRRADFSPGSILSTIGRANMVSQGIRIEVTPARTTEAFASARAMWADSGTDGFSTSGVRDPSGRSGRFAGYEIDSRVRHWLVPGVLRAEFNAVLLVRRCILRDAPTAPAGPTTFYTSAALVSYF